MTTAIDSSPEKAQKLKSSESAKTDLETLELQKEQLSERIDRIGIESRAAIEKLDQDANRIAKKVSDEADSIINYHRSTARKVVETINREEARAKEGVYSLVSSIRYYYWIFTLPLLAFGIVALYTISKFSAVAIIIFPAALVGASLAILYVLYNRISDLQSESENSFQLKNMQEEMTEVAVSLPLPHPDVALLHDSTKALGNTFNELAAASSALVLTEDRIDESRRKEQSIKAFSFALNRYGFSSYQPEIQESFRKQLSNVSDPNSWLAALLGDCKRFFPNVSSSILTLAYFDSIGDKKALEESWEVVGKSPSLRELLAALLVRSNLISGPNISESSVPLVAELLMDLPSYSLETARVEAARFFERLALFKSNCADHLALFDMNIAQGIVRLTAFMPGSTSPEKWQSEVISFIANELLQVDESYVELLLRDATGDPRKTTYWKSIIKSKNLAGLATLLSSNRLQNKHSEFSPSTYRSHMMLVMENSPDYFSLSEIDANLRSLEDTIIRIGRAVERTSQLYRLQLNDFSYIWEFVPKDIGTVESELLSISARRAQLKQSIFDLLYFSSIESDRANKLFKSIAESETESKMLSNLMVSTKFVPKNSFNQNIVPLLRTQDSFDMTNFAFQYARYEKLWSNSETLLSFMRQKKVSERIGPLNFAEILKSCPSDSSSTFEDQMVSVATHLFIDKVGKYELTSEQKEELALATTCLFLFEVGNPNYRLLCQKIAVKPLASKTLYRYVNQADRAVLTFAHSRLDDAIVEAIEFRFDDPHFDYFNFQLARGRFTPRASYLLVWKLDELKTELKKLARNGFDSKALENYIEPIQQELHHVVDEGTVRELLTMQVLTAYTLTISEKHPVSALIDSEADFMAKSAHALAIKKDNGKCEGIIRLSPGKSTRIGLVPLEMSFEAFATKFEEVLQGAVKMYNVKYPSDQLPYPLPCYLLRIFPSDSALKDIPPPGETETRPLEIVRNLVCDSITCSEGLALLTLLQPVAQSKVALRNVIESIVDGAHLYTLLADMARSIGLSKEIQSKFEDRAVDDALLESYNVTRLSQLCKAIADQVKQVGEDSAKRRFFRTMRSLLPEISQLSSRKKEALLRTLFRRMSGIGSLFSP